MEDFCTSCELGNLHAYKDIGRLMPLHYQMRTDLCQIDSLCRAEKVTASILCATDPVAVVALLKELGASPTLTVQIQGESLLNDGAHGPPVLSNASVVINIHWTSVRSSPGAAIVLYTIAYDILKGKSYDYALVIEFIVKTVALKLSLNQAWCGLVALYKAMMACALGVFIGYFFFSWIRAVRCIAANQAVQS
eukprot:4184128-Amphidinium_carterae.2